VESWVSPMQASNLPNASRILVLAPHADDEVFGCGGVIAKYLKAGSEVRVHLLTDGAALRSVEENPEAVARKRIEESRHALEVLGGCQLTYAPFPDRSLASVSTLQDEVLNLQRSYAAGVILAPSFWEIHPDHLALAHAVWGAAVGQPNLFKNVNFLFYEVSAPVRANFLVDISEVWDEKLTAMRLFHSQIARQEYVRQITGLNIYRTYTLPRHVSYAEAYFQISVEALMETKTMPDEWFDTNKSLLKAFSENQQLQAQVLSLHQSVLEVQQSTSWKLLKPLRWLVNLLRS